MPTCSAYGCSNKSGVAKGKSFFKIPDPKKNSKLCKRWLHNIGNANLTIKKFVASPNRVVCSDHFHELCLKRDIRSELCPSFKKCIKLVPGAIPTIFGYRTFDQINIDGTVCHIRRPPKRSLEEKRDNVSHIHIYILCILENFPKTVKYRIYYNNFFSFLFRSSRKYFSKKMKKIKILMLK